MTQETFEILESLCDMWEQFCSGVKGIKYITAVEDCEKVLIKYKLLNGDEINWEKLKKLKPIDTGITPANSNTVSSSEK